MKFLIAAIYTSISIFSTQSFADHNRRGEWNGSYSGDNNKREYRDQRHYDNRHRPRHNHSPNYNPPRHQFQTRPFPYNQFPANDPVCYVKGDYNQIYWGAAPLYRGQYLQDAFDRASAFAFNLCYSYSNYCEPAGCVYNY